MKAAVILFSHGSTLCGAGEQLEAHAERLREGGEHSQVEIGYLNYSAPTFGEAVEKCASAGAELILVAPYFLVPGYFVKVALPKILAPEQERFPHVQFEVAPALGDHELLAQAVTSCARDAADSEHWRAILHSAPQFCEQDEACPLFEKCALTPRPPLPRSGRGGGGDQTGREIISLNSSPAIKRNTPSPAPRERGPGGEGLLIMVHGSPKPESNADMFCVVERVRAMQEYSQVVVGFMECNEPTIPDAIDQLISAGATSVVAVPYFLHAGTHVADDLPTLLEAAQEKYSEVAFFLGGYLGREPLVTEVLRARVAEILCPPSSTQLLPDD